MSATMKRLHSEGLLPRSVQGLALKLHGRCQAKARSTGYRCGNAALPQTKHCRMHSSGRKLNRTRKKNTTHYYRKAARRALYEEMKANRVEIPRRMVKLDTEDRRALARLTGPYINAVRDHHDDGAGLMEYTEQLITIEALDFLAGRIKASQFHERAAKLSEGRHNLPIRLIDGTYESDDEYTLIKGAKPRADTDLGPDYGQGRAVRRKMEKIDYTPNLVTYEELHDGTEDDDFSTSIQQKRNQAQRGASKGGVLTADDVRDLLNG